MWNIGHKAELHLESWCQMVATNYHLFSKEGKQRTLYFTCFDTCVDFIDTTPCFYFLVFYLPVSAILTCSLLSPFLS